MTFGHILHTKLARKSMSECYNLDNIDGRKRNDQEVLSRQSRIRLTGWMISSYGTDIFILRDGWFSSHGTNNFIPRDRYFHSARRITPHRGMDLFSQESAFLSKQAVEFPTERLQRLKHVEYGQ